MSDSGAMTLISFEGTTGRSEFSLDPAARHLNHGSYGAVPRRTLRFQAGLKATMESNTLRWFEDLPEATARIRAELSTFVGAPADEIAVVQNASAAASAVFGSLRLAADDEVLLTDHVYGAIAMGAARMAERWGARVTQVHVPVEADAAETLERILAAVTERTRLLVVDHISSATARRFPVEDIVTRLADSGTTILIDGAHALGILPVSAVRAPHAIWFGNLHKYPCAPRGAAVMVAQGELGQRLYPVIDSWGARDPFPARFDRQGAIDSTAFLASAHAINTLESLFGWDRIRRHSAELAAAAVQVIAPALAPLVDDQPVIETGMPVPQLPLLRLPAGVAEDPAGARLLKDRLAAETGCEVGVSTWRGQGTIRLAPHVYNDVDDYEYFAEHGVPVIARLAREARAGT